MLRMGMRGIGTVGALLVAGATLWTSPASATTPAGVASLGSASIVHDGVTTSVAPVGACDLTGDQTGNSPGASVPGLVSYGIGNSSCTADTSANTSTSTASGATFTLSALVPYGGPRISLGNYQVTCTANTGGTNASWKFSDLTGITGLPSPLPTDYTQNITNAQGTVLAKVVLNEIILPNPNDGSITMNLMHIILYPNGNGPLSGDVYVGSTACSPTAAATPPPTTTTPPPTTPSGP